MTPKIDYSALNFWLAAGQFLITGAVAVWAWFLNRSAAREKDMKEIESRVCRLETESISHDDLGKVYDRINQVGNQVSELTGTVRGIKGAVDMIQDHLLNKGDRK